MKNMIVAVVLGVCLLAGCNKGDSGGGSDLPTFSLAWSEYPSWSVFGVASEKGLINGEEGELGPIEKQWGVDIVLKGVDYDTCLTLYASGTVDAVCMTNMDSLAPCLGRDSMAVLPTSTSVGADACITVGIDALEDLKGKPTFGLEKSVSQYAFERNLELAGLDSKDFPFKNMDPGAAAAAMQTKQENIQSIMVWNPFVLQTLRTREDSKRLFDSSAIPGEIIDMVVVGKDIAKKPGGEDFICAVIDTYYQLNEMLDDPKTGDETLVALGTKFSDLELDDMKIVVQQTKFYKTADEALGLFESQPFQSEITPRVTAFCVAHDIVEQEPKVGFDSDGAQLNYTTAYIKKVQAKQ